MSTTIRRRRPRFEFVQILNAVIRDYRVSWRARGLLTELLSYPEGYETTVDELVKKAKRSGGNVEGRDAMRAAARELKDVGYIVETKYQNQRGHWITEHEVTDDPMYELLAQEGHVSAGRTDDGFPGVGEPGVGSPAVGSPGVNKKTEKKTEKKEGEEGDARARVTGEPSAGDEPVWGVSGGANFVAPTLASANLIREIAGRALQRGENLSGEDHQRLAMLAETVRPVVEAQPGLSWDEYVAWLKQGWVRPDGRRTFKTLPGALGWRLLPEQVKGHAWGWACEQRGAQEASEARGERDVPQPRTVVHAGTCGRHKVALTNDGNCVHCTKEEAEEARQREAERAAAAAAAAENDVDGQEDEFVPEVEELSPEIIRSMYESLTGGAPSDAYLQARAALDAERTANAAQT